ncbi:Putative ribonuclease H protein At1g65750 [Linum perenne]
MLGKQGWKFTSDSNALVTKVFKAKYFPRRNFLSAKEGSCPSLVWKSIWSSQQVLNRGARWRIGDGVNTRAWDQPWIRDDDNFFPETEPPEGMENLLVCDLMMLGLREWDIELIETLFNNRDAGIIAAMPLPSLDRRDTLIWHFSRDGGYTVRSAYRVAMERIVNRAHLNVVGDWTKLWKVRVPARVKHVVSL